MAVLYLFDIQAGGGYVLGRDGLVALGYLSIALRLVAAVLLLVPLAVYDYGGFALGAALLMAHRLSPQPTKQNIQHT